MRDKNGSLGSSRRRSNLWIASKKLIDTDIKDIRQSRQQSYIGAAKIRLSFGYSLIGHIQLLS